MRGDIPQVQISIRVPADALRRAKALQGRVAKNSTVAALGKVTRSKVLKLAFIRGLDALEAEFK